MNNVVPMPRQCRPTWRSAPKSIFISMGTIITQMSAATGRFTCAHSMLPRCANADGQRWPSSVPATMHNATHRVR